jgi:tripartite-type tricarboxylate transporter receptor subunit TctC
MRLRKFFQAIAVGASLGFATVGLAQDYPNRPVKFVVGYIPGAGDTRATGVVAKGPADGYKLLVYETGQLVIAPYIYKSFSYKTLKDFTPVAFGTSEPLLLVVNPKNSIKTLQDLVQQATVNPGVSAYGSSGVGTIHHIEGEVLKTGAGIDMMHIPYNDSGQSVPAGISGVVPILVSSVGGVGAQISAGTLNLLAVTTAGRLPSLPDVSAISEMLKGYKAPSEVGILAPAGLPPAILEKLTAAIKTASISPEFLSRFEDPSTIVNYKTQTEYFEKLRFN